jgi:ABC-type lipoprotein release transport system permease subunit
MTALPIAYPVRNLLARRASTALTMGGIALVVFTFVAVFAMADGIRATFARAGSDRNVLFLRHGATSETASSVGRDLVMPVRTLPGIARTPDGRELVSPEIVVQVLMKRPDGHRVNVALRGITPAAFDVRDGIAMVGGRRLRPGTNEVIVGETLARSFRGLMPGGSFRIGRLPVTVCGVMQARGSSLESEIWIDVDRLVVEYRRDTYSTLLVRLSDPALVPEFTRRHSGDARIKLQAVSELDYYAGLESGAEEVRWLGLLMAFFMACGAVFGAMNTMYQAVAGRTRELATLRALGFSRGSVLGAILLEALVLCACGGALGCLLASPLAGWEMRAVNVKSLTEVGYRLEIGRTLLAQGFLLSLVLGVAGGVLPAWQATRVRVVDALREV